MRPPAYLNLEWKARGNRVFNADGVCPIHAALVAETAYSFIEKSVLWLSKPNSFASESPHWAQVERGTEIGRATASSKTTTGCGTEPLARVTTIVRGALGATWISSTTDAGSGITRSGASVGSVSRRTVLSSCDATYRN